MHPLARTICSQWRDGQAPDARAALEENPDLEGDRSAVVELAYEEFWLRRDRGERIDPDEFVARFPGFRSAILHMLAVDGAIAYHPSAVYVPDAAPDAPAAPPPSEDEWPLPGTVWGDCLLLRQLGLGAFSRVYLAREKSAGDRPVVLKFSSHAGGEACTLGRLHHEQIVPILWARRDPGSGRHVVCMPFYGSATLTDILDRLYRRENDSPPARAEALLDAIGRTSRPGDPDPDVPLPGPNLRHRSFAEGVARLAERLAEALAFLHGRNLAHCDLKPSNVLLTGQGRPLLLDFNLARVGGEPADQVGGTFPYMAPEHLEAFLARQPLGAAEAAGADLFSLGVLLYELLTGRHPFGAPPIRTPQDCAREMLQREKQGFQPIRERNPAVPERLARLVESCLAVDPARRPTAATLARQLRPVPRVPLLAPAVILLLAGVLMPFLARPPLPRDPVLEARKLREQGMAELSQYGTLLEGGNSAAAERGLRRADSAFQKAIDYGPADAWKDHYRRGQVRLLLGDPAGARGCFLAAEQTLRKGPGARDRTEYARVLVYLSYSCTLSREHREALKFGEDALDCGLRSPALLNNLGYTALQLGNQSAAKRYLAEALRRNPNLAAAYRNRATLGIARAKSPAGRSLVPPHALSDIDRFVWLGRKAGRESGELYLEALRLYALAVEDSWEEYAELLATPADEGVREYDSFLRQQFTARQVRARQYYLDARRMGASPRALRDPLIRKAVGKDFYQANQPPPAPRGKAKPVGVALYLVGPFPDGLQ